MDKITLIYKLIPVINLHIKMVLFLCTNHSEKCAKWIRNDQPINDKNEGAKLCPLVLLVYRKIR